MFATVVIFLYVFLRFERKIKWEFRIDTEGFVITDSELRKDRKGGRIFSVNKENGIILSLLNQTAWVILVQDSGRCTQKSRGF